MSLDMTLYEDNLHSSTSRQDLDLCYQAAEIDADPPLTLRAPIICLSAADRGFYQTVRSLDRAETTANHQLGVRLAGAPVSGTAAKVNDETSKVGYGQAYGLRIYNITWIPIGKWRQSS